MELLDTLRRRQGGVSQTAEIACGELGMLTVLRVFAIDSKAVSNLGKETGMGMPDLIEVLPGTIYKVIARLSRELPVPLIAGGLLADKADVTAALSAGALCVSASDPELWDL